MDIKPRKQPAKKRIEEAPAEIPQEHKTEAANQGLPILKKKKRSWLKRVLFGIVLIVFIGLAAAYATYQQLLLPKNASSEEKMRVVIAPGENSATIGDMLEKRKVIKNSVAFQAYAQLSGAKHQLQAGTYILSPADSTPQITKQLKQGKTDVFNVTIYPGQTLKEIAKSLKKQGFTREEVNEALSVDYNHPLLKNMPANTSLEGYIFPETYQLGGSDTLESLITRSMDELYSNIQKNDLVNKLKKQGLTLQQGITLASIIQKEVVSEEDEKQVAQILLKRLKEDMRLDADSTSVFAAKQLGKSPSVYIESPYNTRLHEGLPPGPIGNFNFAALEAVANPASGDYLYFVSGDDGTTHYARTLEEHEKNTRKYCKENCELF